MERSVTESPRVSKRGRIVRWAGGRLPRDSSAEARSIPFPLRALVILRGGLTADSTGRTLPKLGWAEIWRWVSLK